MSQFIKKFKRVLSLGGNINSDIVFRINKGFEENGLEVFHYPTRKNLTSKNSYSSNKEKLDFMFVYINNIIKEINPDILIWIICKNFDCPPNLIKKLKLSNRNLITVYHSFDDPFDIENTSTMGFQSNNFDAAITSCKQSEKFYKKKNILPITLYPPVIDSDFNKKEKNLRDFNFICTNLYPKEIYPMVFMSREEIAEVLSKIGTIDLYGPNNKAWDEIDKFKNYYKGFVNNLKISEVLCKYKISINSHVRPDAFQYLNERTTQILASPSFLFTDKINGIYDLIPKNCFDTFENKYELQEKSKFWLKKDTLRNKFIYNANIYAKKVFSSKIIIQKLLKFLEKNF